MALVTKKNIYICVCVCVCVCVYIYKLEFPEHEIIIVCLYRTLSGKFDIFLIS